MDNSNDTNGRMKKINYMLRYYPKDTQPSLRQLARSSTKSSYKITTREEAKNDLLKLSKEEIERLYKEEINRQIARDEEDEKRRYLNCDADFDYWGKQANWTIDEGCILVLGKDPCKIKWEQIRQYTNISFFAEKFEKMRNMAQGYATSGQLTNPISPGIFLAWARRMDYVLPEKLVEVVEGHGVQIADWQTLYRDAMEIINQRKQKIEIMHLEYDQLMSKYEELKKNPCQMDQESDNYAPELDAANIIYRAIICNSFDLM